MADDRTPDRRMLEEEQADERLRGPRGRNQDSSVSPQYEDSVLPDRSGEHDRES